MKLPVKWDELRALLHYPTNICLGARDARKGLLWKTLPLHNNLLGMCVIHGITSDNGLGIPGGRGMAFWNNFVLLGITWRAWHVLSPLMISDKNIGENPDDVPGMVRGPPRPTRLLNTLWLLNL